MSSPINSSKKKVSPRKKIYPKKQIKKKSPNSKNEIKAIIERMKQRKLERKLIEERNVRKLDEENRKLETVRKLEDVKLEGFQSEFADKIRKLEEGNENEERKLETNRKIRWRLYVIKKIRSRN